LSERGKVGKGAERKVKNHFIDHSYHFIPNALDAEPTHHRADEVAHAVAARDLLVDCDLLARDLSAAALAADDRAAACV
jgi:hypothetical protein